MNTFTWFRNGSLGKRKILENRLILNAKGNEEVEKGHNNDCHWQQQWSGLIDV